VDAQVIGGVRAVGVQLQELFDPDLRVGCPQKNLFSLSRKSTFFMSGFYLRLITKLRKLKITRQQSQIYDVHTS